jgi:hypothetical protein
MTRWEYRKLCWGKKFNSPRVIQKINPWNFFQ